MFKPFKKQMKLCGLLITAILISQCLMAQKILDAAEKDDLAEIKRLFEEGIDLNTTTGSSEYHYSALHISANKGYLKLAEWLISNGAEVNMISDAGITPLHMSARKGCPEIAELLISNGANINANEFGIGTPLHEAADAGKIEIVEILISNGADVNIIAEYDETPLILAAQRRYEDIIQYLVLEGADVTAKNGDNMTPFLYCMRGCNIKTIELLIEKGADVNAKDFEGNTPLHYAAFGGKTDVAKLLIEKGANLDAKGSSSQPIVYENTPLHVAARNGHYNMAALLLSEGAKVNVKNSNGKTPEIIASEKGNNEVMILLQEYSKQDPETDSFEYFLKFFDSPASLPQHLANKYTGIDIPPDVGGVVSLEKLHRKTNYIALVYKLVHYMGEEFYLSTYDSNANAISKVKFGVELGDIAKYESTSYQILNNNELIARRFITKDEGTPGEEIDHIYDYYEIAANGEIHKLENTDNEHYQRSFFKASYQVLTIEELQQYSKADLRIMRNEIFAAYGYIFKTSAIKEYFSSKKWYVPRFDNVDSRLTEIEKKNIDLIRKAESQ